VISIGSYILNQEEMTLSHDGKSAKLEPKVLDVLIYFYKNENRYISMAELHENVWQDRCVSDAAVRRAIGKLRLLFNDDHKNPSYIQSLPKRGYKLICQTSYVKNEINKPSTILLQNKDILQKLINPASSRTIKEDGYPKSDILAKVLQWGNKTFFLLFIVIIALFFIGPLVYRISDIMP